ncbi:MAG: hypothetical protein GY749_02785 [Desulfobacteraceae bacterium]|nr:hypothetical protein [Desulfobacteraceae bacterium]
MKQKMDSQGSNLEETASAIEEVNAASEIIAGSAQDHVSPVMLSAANPAGD